jgi:predicted RNA binding protein YcfA (HicA-like mRNA interferase family)
MSPKLPVVSGEDLIRALEKFGYVRVRQKGSHVRLYHATDSQRIAVTVPLHTEVAFGTLKRILRDTRVSPEQLISVL